MALAKLHRIQGRPEEAIKVLQKAECIAQGRPEQHCMLFDTARDAKDAESARKELEIFQNLKRKADEKAKTAEAEHPRS